MSHTPIHTQVTRINGVLWTPSELNDANYTLLDAVNAACLCLKDRKVNGTPIGICLDSIPRYSLDMPITLFQLNAKVWSIVDDSLYYAGL